LSDNGNPLAGKVAIVTGAAQGIGFGIAQCLARAGAIIVAADIEADALEPCLTAIERAGGTALGIGVDVSNAGSVTELTTKTVERLSRINILVNNAGVIVVKPIDDQSELDWDRVLDTNLKGSFLCSKAVLAPMTKAGGGSIINLCSIAAFGFTTPHVPYTASKAGVHALTRDFAYEVAGRGIRVNAIAPGPIETPMFDSLSQAQKDAHAAKVPLRRLGQPEDIGAAAVFLASDAASFITGVTLPVAGGSDLKYA
jgi:3-oxoacyl-[acyl-carrier protein] reductase